jgi:hypothetical protein
MSPRAIALIVVLVLALAAAGAGALFWIQNASRTVMLSLNLGFTQMQLVEPVQVPALMAICAGAGLLVGFLVTVPLLARANARANRAERQAALGSDGGRSAY